MKKVRFTDPNGRELEVSDIHLLEHDLIDNFDKYWMQGSGDGYFDFYLDDKRVASLFLGPNIIEGLYLHYVDRADMKDLLSLRDRNQLHEVAETAEEIYASKGLFLDRKTAWKVICYFFDNGKNSPEVEWITPDLIPEDGNW